MDTLERQFRVKENCKLPKLYKASLRPKRRHNFTTSKMCSLSEGPRLKPNAPPQPNARPQPNAACLKPHMHPQPRAARLKPDMRP